MGFAPLQNSQFLRPGRAGRLSLYAKLLGTSGPVSEKRIQAALDQLTGAH